MDEAELQRLRDIQASAEQRRRERALAKAEDAYHGGEAVSAKFDYQELRESSEDVERQEQAVRDYLGGDIEKLFTPEATSLLARVSAARVMAAMKIRRAK